MRSPLRTSADDARARSLASEAVIDGFRVERVIATRPDLYTVVEAAGPDGERVSLTLLAAAVAEDRELRSQVMRLARLRASIDHPNLVPFHGTRETEGRVYLLSGVGGPLTLADRLAAAPLDAGAAMTLLGQVAGALETAAGRGLQARDVTPHAITVRGDDHVLLTDLGIAVPPARGCELLASAEGADYRSPEEVRGEPLGPESTVYSLACILVECLTGTPPYPYERPLLTLHAHAVEPPPSASDRNPDLPEQLDAVVAKGMAKDPRERHGSPGELIRAAADALGVEADIPVIAAPPDERPAAAAPALRSFRPRVRLATFGIALALLASVVSGFATGRVDWSKDEPQSRAVRSSAPPPTARLQEASYERQLHGAVEGLRERRAKARGRLRNARRASGQAAGASALARAYRDARRALPAAPPGVSGAPALAEGLDETARAYPWLAPAARERNRRAWRAARRETLRRERSLKGVLRQVRLS
jgi:serine/threonine protein kinase